MTFLTACERCGTCSYNDEMMCPPAICPWCHKPKRRGSKEELVELLNRSKHAILAAIGFVHGKSVATKESLTKWLVDTVKEIEDV